MAETNGSMCSSCVEFVTNGVRWCFGLENVHSGAAGTSDNVKPLISEDEAESVSISEEISDATNYYTPVIADQETPSTENNDSPVPPPVAEGFGPPPPRLQFVSKGSGPKSN